MHVDAQNAHQSAQRDFICSLLGLRDHGIRLRHTFLIAILLVSSGLMVSGVIELIFRYRESVMSIRVFQQERADSAAFKIQQYIETITQTLRTASQTAELVTSGFTDDYQFQLLKMIRSTPAMTTVAALDTTGRVRLQESRLDLVGRYAVSTQVTDDAFVQAQRGAAFFGQVYFVRQSVPYMRIAVPIERFTGDVMGVLMAEVNLKYIWEVISSIRVGETGYAYVVSPQGDLIAHPDISLALQRQNLNHLSQVQRALRGLPHQGTQTNLHGQHVFATAALIPTLGWVVITERLAEEAYAPLYASLRRLALLLLFGVGMAELASWLIERRVLKPLEALRQGAEKLGAGALDYRLHVQTGDEFQVCADAFNRMAAELQTSYSNLEQQVEVRTRELAPSVAELKIASQHKSRFLTHMSHELRTPLNTIMGYTELTLNHHYGEIPDKARDRLQRVQRSSAHLLDLINAVLDIARIEAGRFELSIVRYAMRSIVENVVTALENQAEAKQLTLSAEVADDLPIGQGDERRLTQVLFNLVVNAITYTETGGIHMAVTVSAGYFTVTVTNTGPGIAPADQQRIFESFEQAHASESRVQSGTGLGLAICRSIIEMHGGQIGVRSHLGEGSTFWCTYPVWIEAQKERSINGTGLNGGR